MAVRVCTVGGTWAWRGGWWRKGSALWNYLQQFGFEPLEVGGDQYEWETDLGGSFKVWKWGDTETRLRQWKSNGLSMRWHLMNVPYEDRNLILHSHAGNVGAFCCGLGTGFPVRRVLTIATPNRYDMKMYYQEAARHIGRWHHVCDKDRDEIGFWGSVGDGHVGDSRQIVESHENILLKGVGHSGLLNDEKLFPLWESEGLIDFFRSDAAPDLAA